MIDRVRRDHPGITVVVQSILPVSAVQKAKCSYVNNGRIAVYNALLEELAAENAIQSQDKNFSYEYVEQLFQDVIE